jgi:hypothetical protein
MVVEYGGKDIEYGGERAGETARKGEERRGIKQ